MPGTTLDTNVLLDVLLDDARHAAASERAIDQAAREGALTIGPATLAELVTVFARKGGEADAEIQVRAFLREAGITPTSWPEEAAATAGIAYAAHLKKRNPASVQCPACGKRAKHDCPHCGRLVAWRTHILTDFLIGAHARHDTGSVLTRDPHLHGKIDGLHVIVPEP